MADALKKYRILDLSQVMAGPFGSMILGDMGAEIIKVEPPEGGDQTRSFAPYFHKGESAYFMSLNRNKKSLALDLTKGAGRQIFYELVKKSDVVLDNFRPGILEKLQIQYERLKEINPRIISCSITAFGPDTVYKNHPGYDLIVQAMGGGMSLTGEPGRMPMRMGIPIGDLAGSVFAAIGVLCALLERERTGLGQRVDVSMLDCQIALHTYQALYYFLSGKVPEPIGTGHTSIVPFQAFQTKDIVICISIANEKFWSKLCQTMDLCHLEKDPRFASGGQRLKNKQELIPFLEKRFLEKTGQEWMDIFLKEGIPAGPVNTLDRALSDPAVLQRKMVVPIDHMGEEVKFLGNPIKMSSHPEDSFAAPPLLGQHSREILATVLGYPEEKIAELQRDKIIRCSPE